MKSSARLWLAIAALLAVSLPPKLAMTDAQGRRGAPPPAPTIVLHDFLSEAGAQDLQPVKGKLAGERWRGWRFIANGCESAAYPAPPGGEVDDFIRRTTEGRTLRFVYQGRISESSPRIAASLRRIVDRAAYRLGLREEPSTFYVAVLHRARCDAVLNLPWRPL